MAWGVATLRGELQEELGGEIVVGGRRLDQPCDDNSSDE